MPVRSRLLRQGHPRRADHGTRAKRAWRAVRACRGRPARRMHPARNGPSARQGLRRIPVAAEARAARHQAAQETEAGRLAANATQRPPPCLTPARRLCRHAAIRRARAGRDCRRRIHDTAGADAARSAERPRPATGAVAGQGAGAGTRPSRRAAGVVAVTRLPAPRLVAVAARRAGGRRLRADPAAGRPWLAAPRLPQHPRVAASPLARRGADPARDRGGRPRDRRDDHADGRRPRHRADRRRGRRSDRAARDRPARCTTSSTDAGAGAIVAALGRLARDGAPRGRRRSPGTA